MTNFFVNLSDLDLLEVSGEDSAKFLQGQLTCDVEALQNGQNCYGAACDNKGRVYANFLLSKLRNNYYLEMSSGMATTFTSTLAKYLPFYKIKINDAKQKFCRLGVAGPSCSTLLKECFSLLPDSEGQSVQHADKTLFKIDNTPERYQIWSEMDIQTTTVLSGFKQQTIKHWQHQDIQAGRYQLNSQSIALYTPQSLNLDINGSVSFTKGCYTGQEIVARMHYRGTAKKRLYHVDITLKNANSNPPVIGDSITNDQTGKKLGDIVNLISLEENIYSALAILPSNLSDDATLRLKNDTSENGHLTAKIQLFALK